MTLHRFLLPPKTFELATAELTIGGEIAHQLARVLRLSVGSQILLLDGLGSEFLAEVLEVERVGKHENVRVKLGEKRPAVGEPRTRITLFQGLLKGEKFDYVLQKGTEVGIAAFVPTLTARCVSDGASPAKLERWRKIVSEAAEQSRRGILPIVHEPISLQVAVVQLATHPLALVAWEDEQSRSLRQLLQPLANQPPQRVAWLIGPEGGLSEAEIEMARANQVQSVSLGRRILRAETAGTIAAALTLYTFGDMEASSNFLI